MRPLPLRRSLDEAASSRRPESGFPASPEAERADRVLSMLATMALRYARLGELDAARRAADEALALFGEARDAQAIARASFELGEALLALGDPTCRELLEDAGTLFEDLGDEQAVLRIDRLLRLAEASIEESPRSFSGRAAPGSSTRR